MLENSAGSKVVSRLKLSKFISRVCNAFTTEAPAGKSLFQSVSQSVSVIAGIFFFHIFMLEVIVTLDESVGSLCGKECHCRAHYMLPMCTHTHVERASDILHFTCLLLCVI